MNSAQCSPRLLKVLAGKAPQEAQEILYLAAVFALRLLGLLWSGLFKPKQFCISADQLVGQQVARLLRNQALCVLCKTVFPIQQSFARILEWTSFWTQRLSVENLPPLTRSCKDEDPLCRKPFSANFSTPLPLDAPCLLGSWRASGLDQCKRQGKALMGPTSLSKGGSGVEYICIPRTNA